MSRYQMVCEAHGLTIEQGKTLRKMVLLTTFMHGLFGKEKEAELRSMGLLIDTKAGRMDSCAKLSRTGNEIAQELMTAEIDDEIDDMAASD
ncbi:MAG: hypothetical protein JO272_04135 [Pseudonocardiales bacterium]|nr:hypothetical protein [Pseudonocardiales bacterium]